MTKSKETGQRTGWLEGDLAQLCQCQEPVRGDGQGGSGPGDLKDQVADGQMIRIFAGGKHRSLLRPVCFSATVLGHLLFEAQAGAQVNTKIISGVKLISVFI